MSSVKQMLPKIAYYDEQWYEDEKEHIFEKTWQFICMRERLEKEGAFLLETIGNTPIVVLDENGTIRAFVNMCRHRGMRLLHGEERLDRTIRCPYHNWSYDLKGELKGVPDYKHSFPDMDKSCMGLLTVKVELWQGMVFVNLDGHARPLHETLDPLKDRLLPYDDVDALQANDGYRYIINANWKVFVENYMDVYHLSHIHKDSLKEYAHKEADFEFIDDQWLFYEPLSDDGQKATGWWDGFYDTIKGFNGKRGAYVSMLFPNFGITATENMCLFIHVKPLSAEESEIVVYVRSNSGSRNVKMPLLYDYRTGDLPPEKMLTRPDVMNEDIYVCEMIQKNLRSRHFEVAALAQDYERSLYDHQNIILRRMPS